MNEPKNSLGLAYRAIEEHIALAKDRNERIEELKKEKLTDKESLMLLAEKIKELENELLNATS